METVNFDGFLFEKNKLKEFGFKGSPLTYTQKIQNDEMLLTIVIKDQKLQIKVEDEKSLELYTLYQTSAKGPYVDCVRNTIRDLLEKLRQTCTIPAYFEKKLPHMVLDYIKAKYDVEPEFLWEKFPDYCIFRHRNNEKWFGLLMEILASKLKIQSKEPIQVIDLHISKEGADDLLQEKGIYPGWHMNKKTWISLVLDGTLTDETIQKLIKEIYQTTMS